MAIINFPPGMTGTQWLANKHANETAMLENAFAELLDAFLALKAENAALKEEKKPDLHVVGDP